LLDPFSPEHLQSVYRKTFQLWRKPKH
jgi:hypothetical protein